MSLIPLIPDIIVLLPVVAYGAFKWGRQDMKQEMKEKGRRLP